MRATITDRKEVPIQKGANAGQYGVSFKAETETGPIEGMVWAHPLKEAFRPGNVLLINDDANLVHTGEYRGTPKYTVKDQANVTVVSTAGAITQTPAATTSRFQRPAAQQAAPAPTKTANTGEEIINRQVELITYTVGELVNQGCPEETAWQIAGGAPLWISNWWFGEKGA